MHQAGTCGVEGDTTDEDGADSQRAINVATHGQERYPDAEAGELVRAVCVCAHARARACGRGGGGERLKALRTLKVLQELVLQFQIKSKQPVKKLFDVGGFRPCWLAPLVNHL